MKLTKCKRKLNKKSEIGSVEMLDLFKSILKASFKKRFVLYYCLLLSLIFLGSFPFLVVQVIACAVFVTASALFLTIFAFQFKYQMRLLSAHKNREKLPEIPKDISCLSRHIGTTIKDFGIVKSCTAYVIGKSLVNGVDLLKILTFDERQAVNAHELGHIREHHGIYRALAILPLIVTGILMFSPLRIPIILTMPITQILMSVMLNIAMLAFVMMTTIPINWYLEFRADRIAAKFVGKEQLKSALLKMAKSINIDVNEPSETHPSINERIKALNKLKI